MPPKKKPPSQAGKFKPLKRPAKKTDAPPAAAAAAASASSSSGQASRGRHQAGGSGRTGDATGRDRGGGGRSHSPNSQGRGRGRGGRGRGRGRGGRGGRAGRFIVPTGAAFFTGESAKPSGAGGAAGGAGQSQDLLQGNNVTVSAGTDGAVFMPGSKNSRASTASTNRVARSAAESMAAAARAKAGEGEEIIVAEMLDLEDGDDDGGKKKSVLDGPSRSRMDGLPSLFDDENQDNEDSAMADHMGISDAFLYDSDSSAEERRVRRRNKQGDGDGGFRMPPTQLPFPIAPRQQSMYDCQKTTGNEEEKKMSDDADTAAATTTSSLKLSDPPLQSPFLDLESASNELKQMETEPWFVMKFPTRLPHLDTSSSSANASQRAAALIKSELSGEGPDSVGSSNVVEVSTGEGASVASGPLGYDDTLKDAAAGRYGRIEVRKSGKTELVIGGGEDEPEVRLLVHEGLQCGFRQEAVCINPDDATFVSLGDVGKSLIFCPIIDNY
ncbi:hypothetical protein ACHAXR_010156 [Thalassiosira sp. AJA248-18]